jgi:hypothetical protein
MKRIIFFISFSLLSVSFITAQTFRVGPPAHKNTNFVPQFDLPQSQTQDVFTEEKISKSLLIDPVVSNPTNRGNAKLQVVKGIQGTVSKKMIDDKPENAITANNSTPIQRAVAGKAPSFTESFESYNGTDLNWIPTTWTEKNKTGNVFVNDGTANPTWYITGSGNAYPSNGKYMAWVNYADGKDQDEWLISSSFTVGAGEELLYFDAHYSSYFMYLDFNAFIQTGQITFDFTKPTATMQAYVSTNNGQSWEMVWDAHEDAAKYNVNNINDFKVGKWHSVKKSFIKYAGKSIKIAFRYVGRDGDSMGLDNIDVRGMSPDAFYVRPKGYFYLGYTQDFLRSAVDFTYGPAYENATWINKSGAEAESFNWTFPDPIIDNKTFSTSEKDPQVNYPDGFFKMPLLKASVGLNDSTYIWGSSQKGSYFLTGGQTDFGWGKIGVGNYDRTKGLVPYKFGDNDYVFGTDSTNRLFSVANYFAKPIKKYVLENIWINFGTFIAPPETEFKMIVHKYKTNNIGLMVFGDTIATSTALAQDVKNPVTGFYSLNFQGFTKFDPKIGLDVTKDYLEIEDAILIEFTGFSNNKEITLSVFSQTLNTSGDESNAYVIYKLNNSRALISSLQYIRSYTSLLINLGATYSYLHVDNSTVHLSNTSSNTIVVKSNYTPDSWWLNDALPNWLSAQYNYDAKKDVKSVTFTAQALPDGVESRDAVVKLGTYGSDLVLNIKQDRITGITDINSSDIRVQSQNNSFNLSYSNEFQSVTIMNVSGQQIGSYNLPYTGNFTIPSSKLSKGIYIFKFNGKTSKTIKVIR